jgi:hypothetical protein
MKWNEKVVKQDIDDILNNDSFESQVFNESGKGSSTSRKIDKIKLKEHLKIYKENYDFFFFILILIMTLIEIILSIM